MTVVQVLLNYNLPTPDCDTIKKGFKIVFLKKMFLYKYTRAYRGLK